MNYNIVFNFNRTLSIVKKIGILIISLSLLGIIGMVTSSWVSNSIQGSAHAIDEIGSMRMKSYQLLSFVPLSNEHKLILKNYVYISELNINHAQSTNFDNLSKLMEYLERVELIDDFNELHQYWSLQLKPSLLAAKTSSDARDKVDLFITKLNYLVRKIDKNTETKLELATKIHILFIFLCIVLTIVGLVFLKLRINQPWKELLKIANSISLGDFSQHFKKRTYHDEMTILGSAMSFMSTQLGKIYDELEIRVQEKTLYISEQNTWLSFLYRASNQLHTSESSCLRFLPVLKELKEITPLIAIQLRLYENNNSNYFEQFMTTNSTRPKYCTNHECDLCMEFSENQSLINYKKIEWPLKGKDGEHGVMIGYCLQDKSLTPLQSQSIQTLVEQLSTSLSLKYRDYKNKQLMIMDERAVIARELHDSIAQSLSCLKIKISCLQMQSYNLFEEQLLLIKDMRIEINSAYSHLRELLTTFRLKLSEPGLHPALESTIDEFNNKLSFDVELMYQLPPNCVNSHQAIHLVHIVRESLSNIYKHANASWAIVQLGIDPISNNAQVIIRDNGVGLNDDITKVNHYGITIMNDRAKNLPGKCYIENHPDGGVEVKVIFKITHFLIKVGGGNV
ncbi:nitrate/nitrite two-component system sensor histidine kinase NarX [Shewanella algae]|uniref:nitrate/nitrite two-component system sensor histidine kinase NarX n=1 Tax=Shewanella algae TaxID=38313 RepID=UPI001F0B75B3|nr:nitrate/nitrite two-component system sensor histidine kinase NarX [Shewanella algae]